MAGLAGFLAITAACQPDSPMAQVEALEKATEVFTAVAAAQTSTKEPTKTPSPTFEPAPTKTPQPTKTPTPAPTESPTPTEVPRFSLEGRPIIFIGTDLKRNDVGLLAGEVEPKTELNKLEAANSAGLIPYFETEGDQKAPLIKVGGDIFLVQGKQVFRLEGEKWQATALAASTGLSEFVTSIVGVEALGWPPHYLAEKEGVPLYVVVKTDPFGVGKDIKEVQTQAGVGLQKGIPQTEEKKGAVFNGVDPEGETASILFEETLNPEVPEGKLLKNEVVADKWLIDKEGNIMVGIRLGEERHGWWNYTQGVYIPEQDGGKYEELFEEELPLKSEPSVPDSESEASLVEYHHKNLEKFTGH